MVETIVLKVGGSILTYKGEKQFRIRRKKLKLISKEIAGVRCKDPSLRLVLIHGAGSAGHVLAKEYQLGKVTYSEEKVEGVLGIRMNNQKLNSVFVQALLKEGVPAIPVHIGSFVVQKNGNLVDLRCEVIEEIVRIGCVPVLYGEIVFDDSLGVSVCSGDNIATFLADKLAVNRLLHATDVDGVFDKDPHKNKKARLFKKVSMNELLDGGAIKIQGSHNTDVTGGLFSKVDTVRQSLPIRSLDKIVIFNGMIKGAFRSTLLDETKFGTTITVK